MKVVQFIHKVIQTNKQTTTQTNKQSHTHTHRERLAVWERERERKKNVGTVVKLIKVIQSTHKVNYPFTGECHSAPKGLLQKLG